MSYEIKDDYAEHADARTAVHDHTEAPTHWQIEIEQEIRRKFQRNSNGTLKKGEDASKK